MKTNKLVERFIETQNKYDSKSFTDGFTESAIVHDEGKTHIGKDEIKRWIEHSYQEYRPVLKPIKYEESGAIGVLSTEVSGTFPGSPAALQFHLVFKNELIESLKVTG